MTNFNNLDCYTIVTLVITLNLIVFINCYQNETLI